MSSKCFVNALRCIGVTIALACSQGVSADLKGGDRTLEFEGPITGGTRGYPYSASIVDLAPYGYTEKEYFVSGDAHTYEPAPKTTLGENGRWQVVPGKEVPFKTRILVRTPAVEKFNGTVVVEFMQEYFGSERDTNFRWVAEGLLRRGFAWVGVSLHHEGIDDKTPQQSFEIGGITVMNGMTLERWDPERYGSLYVPSSDLSYDILSQIGHALRKGTSPDSTNPMAQLQVKNVLAVGNTIAAKRLGIFINAVQPLERSFDGFYLQDWTPGEVGLSGQSPAPTGYRLRDDLSTPVMVMNTTNASVELGPVEEGANQRFWTPAGSSHTTGNYMERVGKANERDLGVAGQFCPPEVANDFPVRYFARSGLVALNEWVVQGKAPPSFPQLDRVRHGDDWDTPLDEQGNAIGGLRSPWVDIPVKRYEWRSDCPGGSGRHTLLTAETLNALYESPAHYLKQFETAVGAAVTRGVLLEEDAKEAVEQARDFSW